MAADTMNSPEKTATKTVAADRESFPDGISRTAVRGFRASMAASAIRLKPMAADRAPTMAASIQNRSHGVKGCRRWASTTADRAKGRAKIVWVNLIIRP